jgi:BirA family biotin operon repressor/biotin-[acetyl-CoA-carboxylase] ligase
VGWTLLEHDFLPSTNDEARRLAEEGAPEGTAVRARVQTAGRGRLGRRWVSGEGGLYLSAILRPALLRPEHGGLLPLAAGLAMARLVEGLGARPTLRWPNDLDLGGRKAGGVLCESRIRVESPGFAWVVVGMGLDVAQPAKELEPLGATSLAAALGRALDPAKLAQPLLEELTSAASWAERDPDALRSAWAARAPMLGERVALATRNGPLAGFAESVDATGALVVRMPGGVQRVSDPDLLQVQM